MSYPIDFKEQVKALIEAKDWQRLRTIVHTLEERSDRIAMEEDLEVDNWLEWILMMDPHYSIEREQIYTIVFGPRDMEKSADWFPNPIRLLYELDNGLSVVNQTTYRKPHLFYYSNVDECALHEILFAMDQLIARGEDINIQDSKGRTLLHAVLAHLANALYEMREPLLEWNIYMERSIQQTMDLIRNLLERGADPTLSSHEGETPYDLCCSRAEYGDMSVELMDMMRPYC